MPAECGTNIYICTYILLIWHVIGLDIKCEKIIHIKSHISSSNDYDCMICVCNCTVCIYYGYYYIYTKALLYVLTVMCSMLVVVHPNTLYISSSSRIHRSYVDGSHLKKRFALQNLLITNWRLKGPNLFSLIYRQVEYK